jgi:hypothetical protein
MTAAWIMIVAAGLGTAALRAAGPVLLGGREPPERVHRLLDRLTPG